MRNLLFLFVLVLFCACHMQKQTTPEDPVVHNAPVLDEIEDHDEDGIIEFIEEEDMDSGSGELEEMMDSPPVMGSSQAAPENIIYFIRKNDPVEGTKYIQKTIVGFSNITESQEQGTIMAITPADGTAPFQCEELIHPKTNNEIFVQIGGESDPREH